MKDKIEIHLHTNDNCNLKCVHCYNRSGEKSVCDMPESGRLLELIRYFCAEYDAEIHLEGGEIFLRPELLCQMNRLPEEILRCIVITTNGTIRIDNSEITEMLCRLRALRISVEGHTDEQQRAVRGIALDRVVECARLYQDRGIPVWLRLTMTSLNAEHLLDETLPYYRDKGFCRFQIYEFQPVGRGEQNRDLLTVGDVRFLSFLEKLSTWEEAFILHADKTCSTTRLQTASRKLRLNWSTVNSGGLQYREESLQLKIQLPASRREAVFSYKNRLERNGLTVSEISAENGLSIRADGSVFLCPWDNEESHCILNVYQGGIGHMESWLKRGALKHSCHHCSALSIVFGGRMPRQE